MNSLGDASFSAVNADMYRASHLNCPLDLATQYLILILENTDTQHCLSNYELSGWVRTTEGRREDIFKFGTAVYHRFDNPASGCPESPAAYPAGT